MIRELLKFFQPRDDGRQEPIDIIDAVKTPRVIPQARVATDADLSGEALVQLMLS